MSSGDYSPPAPRGPRHAAPKPKRHLWPRNRWARASLSLLIVVVLIVGGFAGYVAYQASRINKIDVKNLTTAPSAAY